jgi:hypothetical protein
MPRSMVIFERLAYGFLALNILAGVPGAVRAQDIGASFGILDVVTYLVIAALIWAAARKRQRWARWAYVAIVVALVALTIWFHAPIPPLWYVVMIAISEILALVSLYYLYSEESRTWFNMPTC